MEDIAEFMSDKYPPCIKPKDAKVHGLRTSGMKFAEIERTLGIGGGTASVLFRKVETRLAAHREPNHICGLSFPAEHILFNANINTPEELRAAITTGKPNLRYYRNCGEATYAELCRAAGIEPPTKPNKLHIVCHHCGKTVHET